MLRVNHLTGFGGSKRNGPPINTVLPLVTGTASIGSTLSTTDGTWNQNGSIISGYTYQWNRNGTPIGSATSNTYALVFADGGTTITCTVTATNASGSTPATSSGTSVSAFNPVSLSPTGWYDPSDLSTLWKDTAGTTPVTTDGDVVARIDDKSGNGRNLTQATSGSRPLYKTSGGLHWLDFDGADDFIAGAAVSNFIANNAYEACASFRADTIGSNNTAAPYLNEAVWGDSGAFIGGAYLRNAGNAGTAGTTGAVGSYNWDGTPDKAENTYTVAADGVFSQRHESGNLYGRLNSLTETSAASGNTSTMTGLLRIGGQNNGPTQCLDGRVYGFFIKSAVLSAGDRLNIREYMALKSGVTL